MMNKKKNPLRSKVGEYGEQDKTIDGKIKIIEIALPKGNELTTQDKYSQSVDFEKK